MNIIFVEPAFPANQRRFVHALASVGANVYGIGESDDAHLGDDLRGAMRGYYRVGSVTNVQELIDAVRFFQDKVWIDALEATVEAHTMPAAQAREATNIPGTSVRTTWLCRDKPSMKDALRAALGSQPEGAVEGRIGDPGCQEVPFHDLSSVRGLSRCRAGLEDRHRERDSHRGDPILVRPGRVGAFDLEV